MARFDVDTPITTREPTVTVDAGLPPGRHRFRLEVIDREGRRSRTPAVAVVEVQRLVVDPRPPVGPMIDPRPPVGPVIDPTRPVVTPRTTGAPPRRPRTRPKTKKEKP
jgi:hypothetical protein